ncbi:PRTRC system protein D [Ralstonia insidiosa]|jgi:plasmid segregation protein ParM|uniref:PRTRC system protein D n=2 Tax=Ralstonia TaxID=48736 RepID=A0A192A7D5_9RALS|nr:MULTISPECIES: PRTRC system protein D [Ralstonia]KMW44839.1 PRTRC system protein D [Ralstonia sp. MD27]ANJ76299.1 PRTRC system protein D [Ralstonia insidiosa]MBA9846736.1 PRTRC system protein D [Ralstonia pickettii]MBA9852112.1 PRTRC system protein D [Ralstonia pickettii]MBA9869852.1 PRTRC system protein D [Ralstonia insidiosa]
MSKSTPAIVRAIDVGYGNTKHTLSQLDIDMDVKVGLFPSLAPRATQSDFTGGLMAKVDRIVVQVDGENYSVGADALAESKGIYKREVASAYSTSRAYRALFLGALQKMRLNAIDYMVVGLPLTTYDRYSKELTELLTGTHEVPNPVAHDQVLKVDVRRVKVFPQPSGAFYNYAVPRKLLQSMSQQTNLVLDPGYGTLDWFVTEGAKPLTGRCSATPKSVWAVISAVADHIGPDLTSNPRTMSRIDNALRTGSPLTINGKTIDISPFKPLVDQIVADAINEMLMSIGNLSDIDNILITGGGAHLFVDHVKKELGKTHSQIHVDTDPVYSNVRGFQYAGEFWAAMDRQRAAA